MAEIVRNFPWNPAKEQAAVLLAEDSLSDEEIARRVGGSARQLYRWKQHPDFRARVRQVADDLAAIAERRAIGRRAWRVRQLEDRHDRMRQVVRERGKAREMRDVPGGKSGLLVHTVKGVGKGDDFRLIDLYAVDTGLLKELREHEKQAAQELGQWVERKETRDVTDDELDGEIRKLLGAVERNGQAPPPGQAPRAATP